jgi:MFS family permease
MTTTEASNMQERPSEPLETTGPVLSLDTAAAARHFRYDLNLCLNLSTLFFVASATQWTAGVTPSSYAFMVREYPNARIKLLWVTTFVGLFTAVISLVIGQISDQFGRRSWVVLSCIFGIIGSAIMAWAGSPDVVIAGSAIVSIGAAFGFLTYPFTSELVPKEDRGVVLAILSSLEGAMSLAGILLCGYFVRDGIHGRYRGWRIGAMIDLALWAIGLVGTIFFYHPQPRQSTDGNVYSYLRNFDWTGAVLGVTGIGCFLVGLNLGDREYAWDSAAVLVLIIIGGLLVVAFGIWEWKGTRHGLIPHDLFISRNLPLSYGLAFLAGFITFGAAGFFQLEVNYLYTNDPLLSVVYNLPFVCGTLVFAVLAGIWTKIYKTATPPLLVAVSLYTVGCIVLLTIKASSAYGQFAIGTLILAAQPAVLGSLYPLIASVSTPNALISTSITLGNTARGLGGAIGATIINQIYAAKTKKYLPPPILDRVLPLGIPLTSLEPLIVALAGNNVEGILDIPGVTPEILKAAFAGVEEGASEALKWVWIAMLPFAVLGIGLVLGLESIKHLMTGEVVRAVEHVHHPTIHHRDLNEVEKAAITQQESL